MKNVFEFLPIGSVVLLKEGTKRIMITGMLQTARSEETEEATSYDYIGVLYPEGYIGQERMFLFDHDSIEKVYFTGFDDFERTRLIARLDQSLNSPEGEGAGEGSENTAQ